MSFNRFLFLSMTIMLSSFFLLKAEENLLEKKPSNKIIYLITPPRSLSVAFTRMMQERGDHEVFHEPSQYAYDMCYYPDIAEAWYKKDSYATFNDVKTALYIGAAKKPVFAKEISFAVEEFLEKNLDFIKDENVQFAFLMRNPHHAVISFYKKLNYIPSEFDFLIGYESLNHIFQLVLEYSKNKPVIIFTEDLYNNPEGTVEAFCSAVGIPFLPHSLHWSNLGSEFDGKDEWHELKYKEFVHHWHGDAIQSTGFAKPLQYELDSQGKPTFAEIKNPKDREECLKIYLHNLHFSELLKKETDYILVPQ